MCSIVCIKPTEYPSLVGLTCTNDMRYALSQSTAHTHTHTHGKIISPNGEGSQQKTTHHTIQQSCRAQNVTNGKQKKTRRERKKITQRDLLVARVILFFVCVSECGNGCACVCRLPCHYTFYFIFARGTFMCLSLAVVLGV